MAPMLSSQAKPVSSKRERHLEKLPASCSRQASACCSAVLQASSSHICTSCSRADTEGLALLLCGLSPPGFGPRGSIQQQQSAAASPQGADEVPTPSPSSLLARLSERLPCTHLPRGFHLGQHQLHLLFSHVQIKVLLPVLADIRAGACKHKHHARAIRAVRASPDNPANAGAA